MFFLAEQCYNVSLSKLQAPVFHRFTVLSHREWNIYGEVHKEKSHLIETPVLWSVVVYIFHYLLQWYPPYLITKKTLQNSVHLKRKNQTFHILKILKWDTLRLLDFFPFSPRQNFSEICYFTKHFNFDRPAFFWQKTSIKDVSHFHYGEKYIVNWKTIIFPLSCNCIRRGLMIFTK